MQKYFHILDHAVKVALLLAVAFGVTIMCVGEARTNWLREHRVLLNEAAAFVCVLLVLWMCAGGHRSNLWSWAPGIRKLPDVIWIRWLIVAGLIAGTAVGIIESNRLGF